MYINFGDTFGDFVALMDARVSRDRIPFQCSCGRLKYATASTVKSRGRSSCGFSHVAQEEREGRARTYFVWRNLKRRCMDENDSAYKWYGGRGIKVCDRWAKNFDYFLDDMGVRPEDYQIDRIDNNGDYEPDNCQWVTPIDNMQNRSNGVLVTAFGETKTVASWVRDNRCAVKGSVLRARLRRGWAAVEAITIP